MSSPFRYFVDAIFTQYFILPMSILCWRNLWTIYDNFWFPGLKLTGDILALVVGWAGCVLLLALEVPLTAFAVFLSGKHYLARLAFEDLVVLLAFAAMSCVWRGAWNLHISYLVVYPIAGSWANFAAGTVALMVLQLFSNVAVAGCAHDHRHVDDKQTTEQRSIWTTRYARHYLRQWATPPSSEYNPI
jgi:hypothetical protein